MAQQPALQGERVRLKRARPISVFGLVMPVMPVRMWTRLAFGSGQGCSSRRRNWTLRKWGSQLAWVSSFLILD
jgi:hypothetical protein